MTRLAVAVATKVSPSSKRSSPEYRRIRTLMNHDWLAHHVGVSAAQRIYSELEGLMQWDYHYWLQRGSLELESRDIHLAENFLNQAYSLAPNDPVVQTEFGYMQMKIAVQLASGDESRKLLRLGISLLDAAIRSRGGSDPHQYHIWGSQGLRWLKRKDISRPEREAFLLEILQTVEAGRAVHPRDERLRELYVHVQNARLGIVTTDNATTERRPRRDTHAAGKRQKHHRHQRGRGHSQAVDVAKRSKPEAQEPANNHVISNGSLREFDEPQAKPGAAEDLGTQKSAKRRNRRRRSERRSERLDDN